MTYKGLPQRVRQRLYIPFHPVLTEGKPKGVRHREKILVSRKLAVIGLPGVLDQNIYETTAMVENFRIVRIEPLETA